MCARANLSRIEPSGARRVQPGAAIETRNLSAAGGFADNLYWKAHLDNLEGRNEQLRHELREARFETSAHRLQMDKAHEKVDKAPQ